MAYSHPTLLWFVALVKELRILISSRVFSVLVAVLACFEAQAEEGLVEEGSAYHQMREVQQVLFWLEI